MKRNDVPSYLKGYETLYARNPRKAALEWFRAARWGLFMHYGLYSLLGRGEWVQYHERIPVAEYAKLKDRFTARRFDADRITDLALEAGMAYVNLTTRHHDSFCLWETKQSDFHSVNSPARRDLVGELADQCRRKGLGLFLYYSHGRDWKHPHAPNNGLWGGYARPEYPTPQPAYAVGRRHDLARYVAFMAAQITELLTQYGPVAGIWLDGWLVPRSPLGRMKRRHDPDGGKDLFCLQELYDLIHRLQPQTLVSYKWGYTGTEDFFAPEHDGRTDKPRRGRPLEICTTLQHHGWGYVKREDGRHKGVHDVRVLLERAAGAKANLLLNTGPLPGGSIDRQDAATLREVGRSLRKGCRSGCTCGC